MSAQRVLIQALCGSFGRARSCGLWLGSRPDRGLDLQRHRKPWCHVGAGQVSSSFIAVSFTEQDCLPGCLMSLQHCFASIEVVHYLGSLHHS